MSLNINQIWYKSKGKPYARFKARYSQVKRLQSPLYKNVSWFWQNEARLVIPYAEIFDGKIFIPLKKYILV